jgi:hypothetical protein
MAARCPDGRDRLPCGFADTVATLAFLAVVVLVAVLSLPLCVVSPREVR